MPGGTEVVLLMEENGICELLRAVKMLSIASEASWRAIKSSCEVWLAPIAMPRAASTESIPMARMIIEIMTSIKEKPDCFDLRTTLLAVLTVDSISIGRRR